MNRTQSWITIFIVGLLSVIIGERIDMECYFAAYFSFDLTICFLFAFFVSWQLAREGHHGPGRTVSPSICDTLKFRFKFYRWSGRGSMRSGGGFAVLRNKLCFASTRTHSHPFNCSD